MVDPIFPKGKQRKRKIPIQNVSFLQINQEIIIQNNVSENLELLNKTLREIFSGSVSKKVKNYGLDHNQLLIQKIKESKGKARTNKILDMTFLQCLEHFRKSKMYEELSGLELQYDNMIEEMNEKHEKEYMDNFVECLNNYESLYRQKRPKKSACGSYPHHGFDRGFVFIYGRSRQPSQSCAHMIGIHIL